MLSHYLPTIWRHRRNYEVKCTQTVLCVFVQPVCFSFLGILSLAVMSIEEDTFRTQRLLKVIGEKRDFSHNMTISIQKNSLHLQAKVRPWTVEYSLSVNILSENGSEEKNKNKLFL